MVGFIDVVRFQLALLTFSISSAMGNLKVLNFTQSLDHFRDDLSNVTFQQRLLVNDAHWAGAKSGAPIFLLLGGLNGVLDDPNNYGILSLSAVEFKALLVHVEHRFYGDSIPLGSIDLAMADHQIRSCLTVSQALQDYADIIMSLKFNLSAHNSPVIVLGSGYAGALAAWFRLNYPAITIGALASSSPLLYYGNSHPGHGYCSIVSNDFKAVDPQCYEMIRQSWKTIDAIASQPKGLANLSKILNTCRPLQSSKKLKQLLAQFFSSVASMQDSDNEYIRRVCSLITVERDPIEGLASVLYIELGFGGCIKNDLLEVDSPFEPTSNFTVAWAWLRCTGLIYTVGCEHDTMLPSQAFDMAQFEQSCKERFHVVSQPHSPITYFSKNIVQAFTGLGGNIIISIGLKDPFRSGGILKDLSKTIVAITAPNGTFSWDLWPIQLDDPVWLQERRNEELKIFRLWYNQFHQMISNKLNSPRSKLLQYFSLELLTFVIIYVPY